MKEFISQNTNYFATLGGQKSDINECIILYGVVTQDGDGFTFDDGGYHFMKVATTSQEVCGKSLNKQNNKAIGPAKLIQALNGDIILDAQNGDIILKGRNVRVHADGSSPDGDVVIQASKVVEITAKKDFIVNASKVKIAGSNSTSIIGRNYLDMQGLNVAASSAADQGVSNVADSLRKSNKLYNKSFDGKLSELG
jgi:hypothetical protein